MHIQEAEKSLSIIDSIATNETSLLEALHLTEREWEQILSWNNTAADYPQDQCLHQLFEAQAMQTPEATAIIFNQTQLTYRELNCKANQVAHILQKMGVEPDTLVGVYMERSFEMVIAMLAVLKAGGAYVPLDPTYPADRIAYMMQDAALSVVLTQQHLHEQLLRYEARILCLDEDWQTFAQQPTYTPTSTVNPDNLIYVIYTSGSTGLPKGVMNIHRGLVNLLYWVRKEYSLTATDRVLQMISFSFEGSMKEFFWPLLSGATLVMTHPHKHQDPAYLVSLIREQQITVLHFVPSMLHMFLLQHEVEHCTSPKYVICGGEVLSADLQRRFFAIFNRPDINLYNFYGPTEATIEVSRWICQRDSTETTVPIGYPLPNIQLYILSPTLQPVSIGMAGELHIGGVCLARGYLNRPELTREKFIPDPFSTRPGARLYKTGDLARYRPDGAIEWLGRIDSQVKIRGFRIELGEIETVLRQMPEIQEAFVVAREDVSGDKRLVAYVVSDEYSNNPLLSKSLRQSVPRLRSYLSEKLPEYMIPSRFMLLDALPLTPNGKIDRQRLPAPEEDLDEQSSLQQEPKTASMTHYMLSQIWEDLLNVRTIGMKDNFFYLGGNSLLAVRLVDRIEQVFGKRLPQATLFAGPTIEQLAKALQHQDAGPRSTLIAVQAKGTKRPFFFLHGDIEDGAFYCFPLARQIGTDQPFYALEPHPLDSMQVVSSLEEIAAICIDVLRTVQPEGPYLLGGFCNGALVAYEMARQLQERGQIVDSLVLVEPQGFPRFRWFHKEIISRIGKLFHLGSEKRLTFYLRLRYLYLCLLQRVLLQGSEYSKTSTFNKFTAIFPSIEVLYKDYPGKLDWLTSEYELNPFSGKITILWAKEEPFKGIWKEKIEKENIEVRFISGTHITCRTTYLHELAEQLEKCLREA